MLGSSHPDRDLVDAAALGGHLLGEGSVHGLWAERRRRLFPDEMFVDLFPSSPPAAGLASVAIAPPALTAALHHRGPRAGHRVAPRAKIAAVDKAAISPAVAARLVAEQFPQWADLPVERVAIDGWDNTTFRLGDELSVRLPSADRYVAQVDKEHRWLPVLARHLPLPIPEPVALGQPSAGFPRPWSIYRWIEGGPAGLEPIADLTRFAADLADFLGALYVVDANDGPSPGWHNFFRGGSLGTWTFDKDTRRSIELLADEIDAEAATEVWEAALGSAWDRPPVWVHGDVAASNLLVVDGTLRAVIDFGCAGVGDPACDLVMIWNFFTGDSRDEFRRGLPFDDATWARARGWALWKALRTMAREHERGEDPLAAARRFGWRCSPREVIDLVVADHDGSV